MAKMKEVGLQSVGGRIRKARIDASLTTKDLSEKIGVSFAYLGMLERGERNPSIKKLTCIADATGTSLAWLQTGDPGSVDTKSPESSRANSYYVENIDAALFLSIIMHGEPPISEEAIATILNVDQDDLEEILKGTFKYNPKWRAPFTTLALRRDIPGLLNKIRAVESFLERVNDENAEDEADYKLIEAIKSSLSENIHDDFAYTGQYYSEKGSEGIGKSKLKEMNRGTSHPVKQFVFKQRSSSTRWNAELYSELYEPMVEQLVLAAKNPEDASWANENEALVFMEEENYRMALSYAKELFCDSDSLPKVALMLLDLDAMCITEFQLI